MKETILIKIPLALIFAITLLVCGVSASLYLSHDVEIKSMDSVRPINRAPLLNMVNIDKNIKNEINVVVSSQYESHVHTHNFAKELLKQRKEIFLYASIITATVLFLLAVSFIGLNNRTNKSSNKALERDSAKNAAPLS